MVVVNNVIYWPAIQYKILIEFKSSLKKKIVIVF